MFRMSFISLFLLSALFISGCNGQGASGEEADYDTTKKMVVDILQTEDGKKALQDIMSDQNMKEQLIMDSDAVQQSVEKALTSDKGKDMWKKLFEDPSFVKTFAQSMADEQKKLMKDLMSDSEFQQQMIDLLKDPQMTEQMLNVMKSQEFSKHLEDTIQQTLQTPTFQEKISEVLLKAAEEQNKQQGQQSQDGGGSGGGGASGGSGGGGGGSDGGGGGGP
ncbi:spore germination protein D [Lentibacillus halodurans]|uniref:Spore germination protein D n=1 Tax=Lentibacillus halodurans TaxID=237679 RepID=A0A1I1AHL3_9BACI|nr:spore germination lipoprotein GerD [Lentibacillus halodurans]SFB37505.1 spore germination protein D [Lentibacillus halodurans]